MISDIEALFEKKYSKYKCSLKESSYDNKNDEYATTLPNSAYNYDEIIKHAVFKNNCTSCSQDAILFLKDSIFFIEFKNAILEQKVNSSDRSILKKYKHKFNEDIKNKLLLKGVEGLYIFKKILSENKLELEDINIKYILCYNESKNLSTSEETEVDKIFRNLRSLSESRNISFGLFRLENPFYYSEVRTLGRNEFENYINFHTLL